MPDLHHRNASEEQRLLLKQLCTVLYDIQSYLHPSWRPALGLPPHASPRLVNQLLHIWLTAHPGGARDVATYTRPAHLPRDLLHGVIGQGSRHSLWSASLIRCLTAWSNLEGIVYLLGAHASHAALTAAGHLPFLRWQAGAFISVPAGRPGFTEWAAEERQIAINGPPHVPSDIRNTEGPGPKKPASSVALDITLYRLGVSILSTAFGSAQSLLIKHLGLLLPHAAYDALLRPLPLWRGNALQAAFLIDLAAAFQKASEHTSNRQQRDIDV